MTPLFAPRPTPPGVGFGPGFGEQVQAQSQGGWPGWRSVSAFGGVFGSGKDGSWDPSTYTRPAPPWPQPMQPAMPTPQSYGWGQWGGQAPYGAMPVTAPYGQGFGGFGGFAPSTQQQIATSGSGRPWGGLFR
jgi:hypothetical protein